MGVPDPGRPSDHRAEPAGCRAEPAWRCHKRHGLARKAMVPDLQIDLGTTSSNGTRPPQFSQLTGAGISGPNPRGPSRDRPCSASLQAGLSTHPGITQIDESGARGVNTKVHLPGSLQRLWPRPQNPEGPRHSSAEMRKPPRRPALQLDAQIDTRAGVCGSRPRTQSAKGLRAGLGLLRQARGASIAPTTPQDETPAGRCSRQPGPLGGTLARARWSSTTGSGPPPGAADAGQVPKLPRGVSGPRRLAEL